MERTSRFSWGASFGLLLLSGLWACAQTSSPPPEDASGADVPALDSETRVGADAGPEDRGTDQQPEPESSTGLPDITVPDVPPFRPRDTSDPKDPGGPGPEEVEETPPDPNAPVRALFLGNSYTSVGNLTGWVETLADAEVAGKPVEVVMIAKGGAWLQTHLEDPTTLETIGTGGFTHVVLQEQSTMPLLAKGQFLLSVTALNIHIENAGSELVLFETWAREDGHPLYESELAGYDFTSMQAALREAYSTAASANDGIYAPVGDSWELSLTTDPELSLHSGDGSHASTAGVYLSACVLYGALTGETPLGLPAWPDALSEEVATHLQQMAHDTLYP